MHTFGKILPLLFASPPSPAFLHSNSIRSNNHKSIISLKDVTTPVIDISAEDQDKTIDSAVDVSVPRKLINDVKSLYQDLTKGCYSTKDYYSPMVEFKYTSPTHIRDSFSVGDTITTSSNEKDELHQIYDQIQTQNGNDDNDEDKEKIIAIYLPGLDGVGISATSQYDDLSNNFEFWRMYLSDKDTTTSFTDLTSIIADFVLDVAIKRNRKVIFIGESFGGLLVPSVVLKVQSIMKKNKDVYDKDLLKGMVLANPATSFDQTAWSSIVPLLASLRHIEQDREQQQDDSASSSSFSLPTPYSVIGGVALSVTVPDNRQFQSLFNLFSKTKVSSTDDLSDILLAMKDGFGILADKLPAEVIEHRVNNWLNVGCMVLNGQRSNNIGVGHSTGSRLENLDIETLVIAGEDDNMLPTRKEADRLVQTMPNCTSVIVKGSGHFLFDDRFNLTKAILKAPFMVDKEEQKKKKPYDPIKDWKPPSATVMEQTLNSTVNTFRSLTSPVFFSTSPSGERKLGLGFVPNDNKYKYDDGTNTNTGNKNDDCKPLLFIANHQLLGLDLGMIIAQLIEERGINARGLAHPIVFQGGNGAGIGPTIVGDDDEGESNIERRDRDGLITDVDAVPGGQFQTFGAVMVTPRNYYRLMESGQVGLLFPGGVREVFHGKDEAYELFWPEKVDFVRVAARFNATIVPISAVGAADSANILLDAPDVLNLPFGLGERAANSSKNAISARFDMGDSEELFQPPIVVPKPLPARHYFIFGKAFDTTSVGHKDKEGCAKVYTDVKAELRRGLDDLLVAREKDPYKNTVSRLAYENLLGKSAPTFPVDELNH